MRKYLMNVGVITAAGGAFGLIQATRSGPRDWRLLLMWLAWAISLALAIGTVSQNAEQTKRDQHEKLAAELEKRGGGKRR